MQRLAVLCLLAAPAAWGQYFETWFTGGKSLMSNGGLGTIQPIGGNPDDVELTDGLRFGFRVAFNGDRLWGHEIFYAYNQTDLRYNTTTPPVEQGMAIHNFGYNFLFYANHEGNRFRPFATGGVQMANYVPPGSHALSGGGSLKFGVNYGGGLKIRIAGPWAVRLDLRQYTTPKPFNLPLQEGWIRQNEISAGIGFVF
jgi:opacity protein-like surface antigen